MSSVKIIRCLVFHRLSPWLLLLWPVLVCPACVWVPDYGPVVKDGTNPAFTKERRAHAEGQAAKNVAARESARLVHMAFAPSVNLIDAELRPFLPKAPAPRSAADSLTVVNLGRSFPFMPERYEVTASGDFSPRGESDFVEAVRRLQNLLRPRPVFVVHLWRGTPGEPQKIGDYEFK